MNAQLIWNNWRADSDCGCNILRGAVASGLLLYVIDIDDGYRWIIHKYAMKQIKSGGWLFNLHQEEQGLFIYEKLCQ